MNNDAEKVEKIEELLQLQSLDRIFEVVSLALSIEDEEDRDLYLFQTIKWLIKNGIWQKAYGTAQMMAESYEKSEALQIVANYLTSIGHLEKAFSIFDEAEKAALSKNLAEWQQAELLHKIAKSLRQIKSFFKADEIWEKAITIAHKGENSNSQDSADSSSVLAEIAQYLAHEGETEKALNIAQNIKNVGKKERALQKVAFYSQPTKRVA
jgi:tetratricopeptide (TPR) repeat protein